MTETLQHTTELTPKQEQDRLDVLEKAERELASHVLNLCTDRGYDFGDPITALERADTPANID